MEMTKDQIESLAKFALEMLDEFPELGSLDPWDLQEIAEKHKILVPQTVYAPCGDDCNCAANYTDEEFQKGATCYHIAEWLIRAAEQRNEAEGAGADSLARNEPTTWECPRCHHVNPIESEGEYVNECQKCHMPILGNFV